MFTQNQARGSLLKPIWLPLSGLLLLVHLVNLLLPTRTPAVHLLLFIHLPPNPGVPRMTLFSLYLFLGVYTQPLETPVVCYVPICMYL